MSNSLRDWVRDNKFWDCTSKISFNLRNCSRRLFENEMLCYQSNDIHTFATKMRELREDFERLKTVKDEKEVDATLEKYERFIEYTYKVGPWTRNMK